MMPEPILSLENVAAGYRRPPILQNLNVNIARGDSVALIGVNGSGKTTVLKTMAGILPPIAGTVRFGAGKKPVIGYVPQRESLDAAFLLSTFEVVMMGACGRVGPGKFSGQAERELALQALERTGVANLAKNRFAELSGGQKQRALIARALVAQPELLLLDEPTAAIDAAATRAISDLLQTFNSEGITLIMVNHDVPLVRRVARTVLWVREGRLEQGSTQEMLRTDRLDQLPVE
jgi:ABC-type Mn2+/Zn2+ transport system ATPase subunit